MRTYTVEGIVIKRQNIGEADKLITLFTETLGKITLLARGIRKSSSRRVGSLELFNQVKVSAARGRGELDTLTEVQVLNSFSPWRRFLGRITLAYQLCEIVDKLTPDRQPHPEIFTLLSLSLSQISNLKRDWQSKINGWKLQIVCELGYWPKDKEYVGEVDEFIEEIINRPLPSPDFLSRLKQ